MECSIPKVLHGHNLHVASVDDTLELLNHLVSRAGWLVEWAQPVDAMRIMRIDLTKDFHLQDRAHLDALVEGQRLLKPAYRPRVQTFDETGGYTNLRRGSGKRWRMSVYAKQDELVAQRPRTASGSWERALLDGLIVEAEGVLRNELMIRRPVIVDVGVETVADISDQAIQTIHRKYFHRAGLDMEVGGIDKVRAAYILAEPHQQKAFGNMLGMLFLESRNLPTGVSHNTEAKYRKMARDFDLSAADLTGTQSSLRLDYESGLLVAGDGSDR
jgi:hypothetical protein